MATGMDMATFRTTYATTPRREHLVDLFEAELRAVEAQGWPFRALVFGSVVNSDKSEPGDIDALLSISQPFGDPAWRKLDQAGDVQIMGVYRTATFDPEDVASMRVPPACHTAAEQVGLFNESPGNASEGITIDLAQCVEVTL